MLLGGDLLQKDQKLVSRREQGIAGHGSPGAAELGQQDLIPGVLGDLSLEDLQDLTGKQGVRSALVLRQPVPDPDEGRQIRFLKRALQGKQLIDGDVFAEILPQTGRRKDRGGFRLRLRCGCPFGRTAPEGQDGQQSGGQAVQFFHPVILLP